MSLVLCFVRAIALAAAAEPPADLAALLAEAQAASPRLAARRSLLAAAEAAPSQAAAAPDPLASITYSNAGFDSFTLGDDEMSVLELSWSQEIPSPGSLKLAGESARRDVDALRWRSEQARREIVAEVKRSYADLWHADQTAGVLSESRELLDSLSEAARARYETGSGLLQNVLKAQSELARLQILMEESRQARRAAEARLNGVAGRPAGSPVGAASSLPRPASIDSQAIARAAVAESPGVNAARAEASRGEAELELARRRLRPGFMWEAAYGYRGDLDPMITGSFGLPVPLRRGQRQVQAVVQASSLLEASRQEALAEERSAEATAVELVSRADRAAALERLYLDAILPQAHSSYESASAAYGVGRVDFLTVLNDFNALLADRLDLLAQQRDRIQALADLEALTGLDLALVEEAP